MALAFCPVMDDTILARLRILDVDEILPFEWGSPPDELAEVTLIRHPFLVTGLPNDDGYLLLDRTEEFRILVAAGVSQLPVQVCSDSEIELRIPRIGLSGFTPDDLHRLVVKHPDQIVIGDELDPHLEQQFWRTTFTFDQQSVMTVWLRHSSQAGCPYPLEYIFRAVEKVGRYQQIIGHQVDSGNVTRTASFTATLELPCFGLARLKKAAQSDRLFPPRIVKAIPSYRVLHIDFPVSVLMSDIPLSEKETFLRELIGLREQSQKTAFYQGRIYLLNL